MLTPAQFWEHYHVVRQTFAPLRLTRWQLTKLVAAQLWMGVSPFARVLIFIACLLLPVWIISRSLGPKSLRKLGIPPAAKSKGKRLDFKQVLEDSAAKDPNSPFLLNAFGAEYVVFPSRCFDEIKKLPENRASALAFFREIFHEPWSGVQQQTPELLKTIAVELTRAIPSLVRWRQQDCAAACEVAIGPCPDWQEVTLYGAVQDLVASTNASAFVGRDLGTNRKWIRAVDRLPMAVAIATVLVSYTPLFLRSLAKPLFFLPTMWTRWSMTRMLSPIIKSDMLDYEQSTDKKNLLGPKEKGKVQLTGWLMSRYKSKATLDRLVQDYITVSFESTPSSAGTLFFVIGELAADPALADVLREELAHEVQDGCLPQSHLNELRKMDSVMRESARMNGFSHLVLYRKLLVPLKLSIGPELPAGTKICVDAHHINFSKTLWDDPDTFDGLRHYKARQNAGSENRFKFANLGSDAPGWGDGLQACPGRLFADNTLKIALTHLLLNYDFRLRPGEEKPKKGSMPNGSMMPDMKAKVLFRERKR